MSSEPILSLSGIGKMYGATVALDDVCFSLDPGEVCGLLGENGAGKSTLVKILSGVATAGSGRMSLLGKSYRPLSVVDAKHQGVSTAFQELSLVSTLSVATNLLLPDLERNAIGMVSHRRLEREAARILAEHDASDISPSAPVGGLPLSMRQRVEIIRALRRRPRVLLLDEPTAALSDREWLFRLIGRSVAQGTGVLYVSHKLGEIRQLCRRCVILRNGRKVADALVSEMSDGEIFSSMAGRSLVKAFARTESAKRLVGPAALRVSGLTGGGFDEVSFALAPGEILGIAGLEGQGQSALFRALVGLQPLRSGVIEVGGTALKIRSPRTARKAGVVLVPEDRKSEGIFPDLRTQSNISLPVLNRISPCNILFKRRERRLTNSVAPAVDLADRFLPRRIAALSGGNQQKAVLARALVAGARCLMLFDPTRGVDVGAKQSIYRMMRQFTETGGAILFYSTELDELVNLCDRCLVLYRHRVVADLPAPALSQEHILAMASGHRFDTQALWREA